MQKYLFPFLLALPLHAADFQRDLSPDRPDTTESPYTVEKGRFQLEFGSFGFTKDRSDGIKTETLTIGETNFKIGLNDSQDLQIILDPWIHEHHSDGTTVEGFGDIEVRLKWNLWGDDSGKTAGAIIPHVSIPTQTAVSTGEWEGGVIFPVSVTLNDKFDLGFELEVSREWDEDSSRHDWRLLHSVTLGYSITENLGSFIEYVGVNGGGPYEATADAGLTYNITKNLQADLIVAAGINKAADDFSISQGFTVRF